MTLAFRRLTRTSFALFVLCTGMLTAQASPAAPGKTAVARPATGTIHVDGRLDDTAWRNAAFFSDFQDKEPVQYRTPSVRTEVAFLYDGDALYVGARLHRDRGRVPHSLSRRDQYSNAEHLVISLDSQQDRRTAFSFVVTAGGTRIDYYHGSDTEFSRDFNFNPVWVAGVQVDSLGWTAEMRIPFSQLRFRPGDEQTWGLNINRWVPDRNEDIYWVVVPREATGWSSRFGQLTGIRKIRPSRRIELLPYVASDATFTDNVSPNNPFEDGSRMQGRAGADLRMGLGPSVTLEATINPDFGQVEADPAELNLSAFETFFSERRPFFTEGSQFLPSGGFFFSRRIGAAPRGPADGLFVDRPANTTILSAAKVTGRLPSGLSIGALAAVTDREFARVLPDSGQPIRRVQVAPRTVYALGRLRQEFGRDASTVGVSVVGMRRALAGDSALRTTFSRQAYGASLDGNLRFKGGEYVLSGNVGMSHVTGDTAVIRKIQEAPAHFFQRPDAGQVRLDPTRTSLTGFNGSIRADKNAGRWLWGIGVSTESPSFETNDYGRLSSANDIDANWDLNLRQTEPGPVFRSWRVGVFNSLSWNYDGNRTGAFVSLSSDVTWTNFWNTSLDVWFRPRNMSDDLTRGGPLMQTLRQSGIEISAATNRSAPNRVEVGLELSRTEEDGWEAGVSSSVNLRPTPAVSLSLTPNWSRSSNPRQFLSILDRASPETFGRRYQFARIDQTILSLQARLNYTVTPNLTLEGYAEPFTASGRFDRFGELATPGGRHLRRYGTDQTTVVQTPTTLDVTDARSSEQFSIGIPDFTRFSFRSNLVLRWEWTPGSTLFLVWQQDKFDECGVAGGSGCLSGAVAGRRPGVSQLFDTFQAQGRNFLAFKASYWIPVR